MTRLATSLFAAFVALGLVGWASNAHPAFEVLRFLSIASLMTSLLLFLVLYVRTPDVPGGDRP
ncbi:MAG: hypothetical protein ACRC33_00340 [Gemmataceae bacterium]